MKKALIIVGVLLVLCICGVSIAGIGAYFMVDTEQIAETFPGSVETLIPPEMETAIPPEALPEEATPEAMPEPTAIPAGEAQASQGGNDFVNAAPLSTGTHTGQVEPDQNSFYKVKVPNGGVMEVSFMPGEEAGSMDVFMYGPEQEEIWDVRDIAPTVSKSTRRIMNNSSGGYYFIQVRPRSGGGNFTLDVALHSQNDADSGDDAGDELLDGLEVSPDQTLTGLVGNFDQADFYQVPVPNAVNFHVTFTPDEEAGTMDIFMYDPEQEEIWDVRDIAPTVSQSTNRLMNTESGGTYYLQVRPRSGPGFYTLELSTQPQNDATTGGDAPARLIDGIQIEPNQVVSGLVGSYDQQDAYQFVPAANQTVSFTPGEDAGRLDVFMYDPEQEEIWDVRDIAPTTTETYQFEEVENAAYYLLVSNRSGGGSYTVTVQ